MYCLNIVSLSLEFYSQTNVYACVWPVCTDDLQLLCLHTQTINPVYTSASLGSCLQAVQAGWPEVCSTRPSTNVGKVIRTEIQERTCCPEAWLPLQDCLSAQSSSYPACSARPEIPQLLAK